MQNSSLCSAISITNCCAKQECVCKTGPMFLQEHFAHSCECSYRNILAVLYGSPSGKVKDSNSECLSVSLCWHGSGAWVAHRVASILGVPLGTLCRVRHVYEKCSCRNTPSGQENSISVPIGTVTRPADKLEKCSCRNILDHLVRFIAVLQDARRQFPLSRQYPSSFP